MSILESLKKCLLVHCIDMNTLRKTISVFNFLFLSKIAPDLPKNTAPIPCSSNKDPLAWHVFRFGKKLSKYKRWIIGLKCHQHFYVNDRSIWLKRVMLSFICILAECGNSCFNVLATAENIEYLLFGELWKNLSECFKSRTVICCNSIWTRRWTTKKRSVKNFTF